MTFQINRKSYKHLKKMMLKKFQFKDFFLSQLKQTAMNKKHIYI